MQRDFILKEADLLSFRSRPRKRKGTEMSASSRSSVQATSRTAVKDTKLGFHSNDRGRTNSNQHYASTKLQTESQSQLSDNKMFRCIVKGKIPELSMPSLFNATSSNQSSNALLKQANYINNITSRTSLRTQALLPGLQPNSTKAIHRSSILRLHNQTNQYIQSEIQKQLAELQQQQHESTEDSNDLNKNPLQTGIIDNLGKSLKKINDRYKNIKPKINTHNESFVQGFQHQDLIDRVLEKEEHSYQRKSPNISPLKKDLQKIKSTNSDITEFTLLKPSKAPSSDYRNQTEENDSQSNLSSNQQNSSIDNGQRDGSIVSALMRLFEKRNSDDSPQQKSQFFPMIKDKSSTTRLNLQRINTKDVIEERDDELTTTIKNKKTSPFRQNINVSPTPTFKSVNKQIPHVFFSPSAKGSNSSVNLPQEHEHKSNRKNFKDTVEKMRKKRKRREQNNGGETDYDDDDDYINEREEQMTAKAMKAKESENYQKFLLMRKGLNKEYVEEYKLTKMTKMFERRSLNPRLHLNKNQIMKQLMATFTNNTYLVQLKQKNKDLEKQLHLLGINYDSYKTLANQMIKNFTFTKERKTLIQRVGEIKEEKLEQDEKEKELLRQKMKIDSLFQKELNDKLRNIIRMQAQSDNMQYDPITKAKSQQQSPDFSKSVIMEKDGGILIANDKQFQKLLKLVNQWYEADEPVDQPFFRQFTRQNSKRSSNNSSPLASPTSSNSSPNRPKKHKINPKHMLNNMQNKSGMGFSIYSKGLQDKEMPEFSKYCNQLLLKTNDKFMKRKLRALQKKQQKNPQSPNFFERMQEDQKKRAGKEKISNFNLEIKDHKLDRLKKLTDVTRKFLGEQLFLGSPKKHLSNMIVENNEADVARIDLNQTRTQNLMELNKLRRSTTLLNKSIPEIKLEALDSSQDPSFQLNDNLDMLRSRFMEQRKSRMGTNIFKSDQKLYGNKRTVKFDIGVTRLDDFDLTKRNFVDPIEIKIQQIENEIMRKKNKFRYNNM